MGQQVLQWDLNCSSGCIWGWGATTVNLTVQSFIKQAETTEDLNEWRSALENALAQAPSVANTAGQHPVANTDITEPAEAAVEQCKPCLLLSEVASQYSLWCVITYYLHFTHPECVDLKFCKTWVKMTLLLFCFKK